MEENRYSLWLVFKDNKLDSVVSDLNEKTFLAHAGIISIIDEPINKVKDKLPTLLQEFKPFTVYLEKLTHFDNNPGGVYFLLEQNSELKLLIKKLKKSIKHKNKAYSIPTHLTITYEKLSLMEKEKVIQKYSYLEESSYLVNAVYLAQTNGNPCDWKIIQEFKF